MGFRFDKLFRPGTVDLGRTHHAVGENITSAVRFRLRSRKRREILKYYPFERPPSATWCLIPPARHKCPLTTTPGRFFRTVCRVFPV